MIGRRDYETRFAARVARLEARAGKLRAESATRLEAARRVADGIPFGQPILVGHHSEKRHRKDLERMTNNTRRGIEAGREAERCEARAANPSTAISSDDPTALDKVREKIARLEAGVEFKKRANALIRSAQRKATKAGTDPIGAAVEALVAGMPCQESTAREFLKPDFAGRIGFPSYELTNTGAEIRRLRARVAELERADAAPARAPETFGDVRLEQSDNRVQVFFPGKPDAATRDELKGAGFKWAPSVGAWQRMAKPGVWELAARIAKRVADQ